MSIKTIMAGMIDGMFPQGSPKNKCLEINLCVHGRGWKGEEDETVRDEIKVLIHRPTNYTKVLINRGNGWMLQSHHDSCWREDGFRFMANMEFECESKLKEKGCKDINTSWYIAIGRGALFVEADVVAPKEDKRKVPWDINIKKAWDENSIPEKIC